MWRTASTTLALLPLVHAFYLPGTAPTDYKNGDPVQVFVNVLNPKADSQNPKLVCPLVTRGEHVHTHSLLTAEIIDKLFVSIEIESSNVV